MSGNDVLDLTLREARGPFSTLLDRLTGPEGKLWLERLNRFNRGENPFVDVPVKKKERAGRPKMVNSFLTYLVTLNLDATDGTKAITGAKEVFPGGTDADFARWGLEKKQVPTPETKVICYELSKDGILDQIFRGFGVDLNALVFTPHQIREFCHLHKNKLRTDGYGNFFLMKREKDEANNIEEGFFVANASFGGRGRLVVPVYELEFSNVLSARNRRRFFVPKLKKLKP
ncbi:MAG: hypothetical protein WC045_01460 [Patescibacteria group bacterium]